MPTHPTEITPPHTASSDPAGPIPPSTGASQPTNPPDLRARRGTKSAENPAVPPTDRPTLPAHINPDALLFQYAASTDPEQLATRHDIDPESLFAWADHPHTQRLLERLRAFNEQRAPHIRAHAACAATAALAEIVRAPLYLSGAEISLSALRSQEITLRAALAILTPIERAATAKRTLTLRRALAALNPRKSQVAQAAPGGAGLQPAGSARPNHTRVPPVPPMSALRHRCSHPTTPPATFKPTPPAITAPRAAGLQPADSARPRRTTPPLPPIPSINSPNPTPAQNLRHRAGDLPRAP